jgi:hypothetical protein
MRNNLCKFNENISEKCCSHRNDKMLWINKLLYFSNNNSIIAIFLCNFPNSIFCKPNMSGLVDVVHCSVFWNRDIALLPNGREMGKSTMKLLIRDTACVGYEVLIRTFWIHIFQTVYCSVYKGIETAKVSNIYKLYNLLWNIFMCKCIVTYISLLVSQTSWSRSPARFLNRI